MKTVMVLAGVFLLLFSENLLACHESDFDGEELLVGTSFFGGHTGDNKMGRAVSVKENFKMLTGNITQATTVTSNYTIDTFATFLSTISFLNFIFLFFEISFFVFNRSSDLMVNVKSVSLPFEEIF